jgi:hypothetical protein
MTGHCARVCASWPPRADGSAIGLHILLRREGIVRCGRKRSDRGFGERVTTPRVAFGRRNIMRSKALVFVTAILLTPVSLAFGQGGGGGSSGGSSGSSGGSTGSTGSTSGAPGTSTGTSQNSVPSGTGPTPAPTPGQSFTFPSNAGTPGTGSSDTRIPSGTGPTPAPTVGQSTSAPSGSGGTTGSAQRPGCGSSSASGAPSPSGVGTTAGGTPRIAEDPNVPRSGPAGGGC